MASISEFLFGQKAKTKKLPAVNPQQEQFQQQFLQMLAQALPGGSSALQDILGGGPEAEERFAAPAMRQFQESVIPAILERFGGGESGASSGLFSALGEAGKGLSESLAAQRGQRQSGALSQLFGGVGDAMRPTFGYSQQSPTYGILGEFLKGFGSSFNPGM